MKIKAEREGIIGANAINKPIHEAVAQFFNATVDAKYSYCFDWLERPIFNTRKILSPFKSLCQVSSPL
jgi:hypothetical protein